MQKSRRQNIVEVQLKQKLRMSREIIESIRRAKTEARTRSHSKEKFKRYDETHKRPESETDFTQQTCHLLRLHNLMLVNYNCNQLWVDQTLVHEGLMAKYIIYVKNHT